MGIKGNRDSSKCIYCCGCKDYVFAKKVSGDVIYPHRPDLYHLVFYRCDECKEYIGTHKDNGEPFGSIPTPELRIARINVHKVIDPLWHEKKIRRGVLYSLIADHLNINCYHTGEVRDIETANKIIEFIKTLSL